jgi:hypothetical protein
LLVAFRADTLHEATLVTLTDPRFDNYRFLISCFVNRYPSVKEMFRSTRYKLEGYYPATRSLTRPLVTTIKRLSSRTK